MHVITKKLAVLPVLAAVLAAPLLVASLAEAQVSGGVSGSATISVGTPAPPPPPVAAQPPPPPVVYQPGPQPQPYGYAAVPPPPPPPPPPVGDYLHDGFYLRFAVGGGGFGAKGGLESDSYSGDKYKITGAGFGVDLAIGGSPIPGLTIGGEYLFQQASKPSVQLGDGPSVKSDANLNFGLLGPFLDWYPDPEGGFHVGATLGLALLAVTTQDINGNTDTKDTISGVGGALGVGYDFFVARQLSLGILGKVFGGSMSKDHGGGINEKYTVSGGSLMFSVLYH